MLGIFNLMDYENVLVYNMFGFHATF